MPISVAAMELERRSIGAALLCTGPALLLVLFGPIVFAFMYGNQAG